MSWSWWGAPGVLVMGLAWALAVVALRAGPGQRLNRLLAVFLVSPRARWVAGEYLSADGTQHRGMR